MVNGRGFVAVEVVVVLCCVCVDERHREEEFYKQRGLPLPRSLSGERIVVSVTGS